MPKIKEKDAAINEVFRRVDARKKKTDGELITEFRKARKEPTTKKKSDTEKIDAFREAKKKILTTSGRESLFIPAGDLKEIWKKGSTKEVPSDNVIYCQKEKLAILGTAGTLPATPWEDPEFEIWAVAQVATYPAFKRGDLLFEMHNRVYWDDKNILERLNKWNGPIYMMDHYKEVPRSIKYPLDLILQYRRYHTTSITYLLALAYHSFVKTHKPLHVAMFGVHMEASEEYTTQRPCCEYWLGRMEGAGIDVFNAGGAILRSNGLYAYEGYNPLCVKFRERLDGLANGARVREEERDEAEGKRREQIGAMKEAEFWLRLAQTGEINNATIKHSTLEKLEVKE